MIIMLEKIYTRITLSLTLSSIKDLYTKFKHFYINFNKKNKKLFY